MTFDSTARQKAGGHGWFVEEFYFFRVTFAVVGVCICVSSSDRA